MSTYAADSKDIASSETSKVGLFGIADGKNFAVIFVLITSLFSAVGSFATE
jgi:hypothetical protein